MPLFVGKVIWNYLLIAKLLYNLLCPYIRLRGNVNFSTTFLMKLIRPMRVHFIYYFVIKSFRSALRVIWCFFWDHLTFNQSLKLTLFRRIYIFLKFGRYHLHNFLCLTRMTFAIKLVIYTCASLLMDFILNYSSTMMYLLLIAILLSGSKTK